MPAKKPAPAKKAPAKKAPAKKAPAKVVAMTKAAILAEIATKAGITKKQAEDAYATLLAIAYAGAKNGITLPGLVKLSIGKRAARIARNPRTGAEIKVPAAKVVKAKVLKALKDGAL